MGQETQYPKVKTDIGNKIKSYRNERVIPKKREREREREKKQKGVQGEREREKRKKKR